MESDDLQDLVLDTEMIPICNIKKIWCDYVEWNNLTPERKWLWVLGKIVTNIGVPYKPEISVNWVTISFLQKALLHGVSYLL
jgi:hypothetical protein